MTNENPAVLIDYFGPATPYFFLSNFSPSPFLMFDNAWFPTVEHAFAYGKIPEERTLKNEAWRERIREAETPREAKKLGRTCPLRSSWEEEKIPLMYRLLRAKFEQNHDLLVKLRATGEAYLQEGTYWNDRVWGVDLRHTGPWDTRPGRNLLGIGLMTVRKELR